jgi:hypothetical protein
MANASANVSPEVSDDMFCPDGHGGLVRPADAKAGAEGHGATTASGHGRGRVRGGLIFARALDRDAECKELRDAGLIVAEIEGIGSPLRGHLADVVDEAIERELEGRGAGAPGLFGDGAGLDEARDRDAALSDQLFRARRVGAPGVAVVLGPLRAAAGPLGALHPEDSATLRFFATATRERPLLLLLDDRDASTLAYPEPVPLATLMATAAGSAEREPEPAFASETAFAPEPEREHAFGPEPALALPPLVSASIFEPEGEPDPEADPIAPPRAAPPSIAPAIALTRHTAGATIVDRDEPWRTWTLQLVAARGPQPLAALERLFTDCYMPLANAVAEGLDDPRARATAEEFRTTFTRGYTEAFATFAATTKRPRMVLDVHDTASRIARLHGARSTRMLLVDAMRWDMSRLVQQRLTARLGARAVVTDEVLLWSALPTTTMRQLETIARGIEALRAPGEIDADAEPPRGRTAEYVRRLRVGPREVHKLDVIESRLQGARGAVLRSLPEIADVAAETIARHVQTLAPNTLLFVFGDHGFTIDRTGSARQGGATPEEVLVGAFALLVGDVH